MGLFDTLLNRVPVEKKYIPQDIREAYASVLYCCANAEGNISDDELTYIHCLFNTIHLFSDHDGVEYLLMAEKTCKSFTPLEMIEGSLNYISENLRPQLFCYCCDIFLSDGMVTEEEKKILEKISKMSGLDDETARKIVEVALIRNIKDEQK